MADPISQRAAFAREFIGNTTNLDQRRRYAQDISAAKERDDEYQRQEFESAIARDPKLALQYQKENRALQNQMQVRDLAERRFQWDQEKAGRMESLTQKRFDLQINQEKRLLEKAEMDMAQERLKLDREVKEQSDMIELDEFDQTLRDSYGASSPQYKEGMLNKIAELRYVPKEQRDEIVKRLGYPDPEAALAEANAFIKSGGKSVRQIPLASGAKGTIEAPGGNMDAELNKAFAIKAKADQTGDEDYIAFATEKINQLKAMKGGTAQPASPAAPSTQTTAQVAVVPVRRKAPDGSIWLFDPQTKKAIQKVE